MNFIELLQKRDEAEEKLQESFSLFFQELLQTGIEAKSLFRHLKSFREIEKISFINKGDKVETIFEGEFTDEIIKFPAELLVEWTPETVHAYAQQVIEERKKERQSIRRTEQINNRSLIKTLLRELLPEDISDINETVQHLISKGDNMVQG